MEKEHSEPKKMALEIFAEAVTPEQRKEALTELIANKTLPKQADDLRIALGRDLLLKDAQFQTDERQKLLAIAESIRLGQVIKRWQPMLNEALSNAIKHRLPPMSLLSEADDRLNVARACATVKRDWMPDYLAESIAQEEQGEKARTELITTLIASQDALVAVFLLLSQAFSRQQLDTESPGDSIARRLARTIVSLRAAIMDSEIEAGEGIGGALYSLIQGTFSQSGRPTDDKVKLDVCEQILLLVHDILRTRISQITNPEIYRVVAYCRQLLGGGTWPEGLKKPLDRLITDVSEALLLLGKQGQMDKMLLSQFNVLCNYPERARSIAKRLAEGHPELPEDVRHWLSTGKIKTNQSASDVAIEMVAGSADAAIGQALQNVRELKGQTEILKTNLLSSLEVFEPNLVAGTEHLFDQLRSVTLSIEQAAALRRLDIFGVVGEEVEFSTKFYDVAGKNPRQKMSLLKAAIVKKREDGSIGEVVLKGLVE